MKLRLQHPPTPPFAANHAEIAVSAISANEGIALDFSPDSLKVIDWVIQGFHAEGLREEQIGETIFTFGCYAGEVLVRTLGAAWAEPHEVVPESLLPHSPFIVVRLPDGRVFSPISKAFNELENGEEDSLAYLHQVAAQQA